MKSHYQVLIVGGGTAGIMTAAQLLAKKKKLDIAIIEPSETHYYQPAWTLVGAGAYDFKKTAKPMADVMPSGVDWVKDKATGFNPEQNSVSAETSRDITYDYLVVAPGLVMEPSLIKGLPEALEKGVACSNYINPEYTWEVIRNFKKGNALFTQPTTPIKCGGAPQKIAYLAADHFRKQGLKNSTNVIFATPGSVIFGVKEIRDTLTKVIDRYGIHFKPFYSPKEIDVENRILHFNHTAPEENRCIINEDNELGEQMVGDVDISVPFDMLHLAPPQAAPKFVRDSVLVNDAGWLDVDHHSMQHNKYPNIFGMGDVAALPTAKTGAAVRKQVPVVVDNIQKLMSLATADNTSYNGYSSCPLVTGYGKMTLAEFDYKNNFIPDPKLKRMLVFNSDKEHWRLWMLKKYGLPHLYWNKMLKGKNV
ncbi:NAD(P)/FAD-dependent oxidoreductase [Flagellimonas zhangzhouensis]|uniref:Sulfide:quinone oxidoreductase n=1 Tax=Flagellimonas zhangzhouensis TaxID=1073328 RepID=A0A1H2U758_9FLAO|nr:FAD/NAD(P)-binding oxidoreductase [Allomuricauda zhangzhouensis]SDQ19570.1 sulfide:quinone oxidoreductase [Allomuricauda zhangzhouensis]SDW52006.1 sulfide:quinone oxidoreductase [Allomuricauda zhangzhouensis]